MQDSGSQVYGDSVSGSLYDFTRFDSGGLLEYLNGCSVFIQTDDLAYQLFLAYIDHLGHLKAGVAFDVYNRAVDSIDNACSIHGVLLLLTGSFPLLLPVCSQRNYR